MKEAWKRILTLEADRRTVHLWTNPSLRLARAGHGQGARKLSVENERMRCDIECVSETAVAAKNTSSRDGKSVRRILFIGSIIKSVHNNSITVSWYCTSMSNR